jgi:predicted nucleic acid-binding Zn ribbon protein
VRRTAPRPLATALERVVRSAEPATLLARVQAAWPEVAGSALSREAEPVAERERVVTMRCASAVWAQELELLGADLTDRLNARLGEGWEVARLRFVHGSRGARP